MIELKFYRDDEYVYINNPDGVGFGNWALETTSEQGYPTYTST